MMYIREILVTFKYIHVGLSQDSGIRSEIGESANVMEASTEPNDRAFLHSPMS